MLKQIWLSSASHRDQPIPNLRGYVALLPALLGPRQGIDHRLRPRALLRGDPCVIASLLRPGLFTGRRPVEMERFAEALHDDARDPGDGADGACARPVTPWMRPAFSTLPRHA